MTSKEKLEALDYIWFYEPTCQEDVDKRDAIIKELTQDLDRLEQIDNAKPSEALDKLEYICKILNEKRIDIKWLFKEDYITIKQALLKAQEQDKILSILKKKNVYMFRINNCINAEEYNEWVGINVDDELAEEEFNLIKGVVR